ncbi:transcription antitermination factor NusB [Xylocopilactobacillus apicola]|uniref:Transcription antitermination protein NusB n=1 Tax=Xylocopilactobacillus apicola TaxID=2932184 RepID=A0AAU9DQI4_9LACO|nr:transcription antitermination factor NusB [Xylocopilactobacillus apicola]BDR58144.1 N utilization substance protein B [Xylocopilactobacillus apicola]
MKRRKQRDLLVKAVFAHFFQTDLSVNEIFDSLLENFAEEPLTQGERENYLDPLIDQLVTDESLYQELIQNHLKKTWKLERIARLDLAILEVAVSEIKNLAEVPFDVTVNEAVDLAKLYSTEKSPSFVNGILVQIFDEVNQDDSDNS